MGTARATQNLRDLRIPVELETRPSGFCPTCLLTTALEGDPQVLATGSCIEDYELLNEIAHGGMGIVYRARQRVPSRVVAVKMILPAQLNSAGRGEAFSRGVGDRGESRTCKHFADLCCWRAQRRAVFQHEVCGGRNAFCTNR